MSESEKPVEIVMDKAEQKDGTVVVVGRVSALNVEWEIARAPYNTEKLRGYLKFEPENLALDLEVPVGEDVVAEVYRRLAVALDVGMARAMGGHLEMIHTPPPEPKGGVRIGGEGGYETY